MRAHYLTGRGRFLMAGLAGLALGGAARGDVVYDTGSPFGGPFGLWGYDVSADQSVGVRFTATFDGYLERVGLWFMNNSDTDHPLVHVTLRADLNDGQTSIPSNDVFESWTFNVSALGWDPMLEGLLSPQMTGVDAGVNYWIVCESQAQGGFDGVWNIAAHGLGFMSNTSLEGEWYPGNQGAVVGVIVEARPLLTGDTDFDCDVDLADLAFLLANFGAVGQFGPRHADFDYSGSVDLTDLADQLAAFGANCD